MITTLPNWRERVQAYLESLSDKELEVVLRAFHDARTSEVSSVQTGPHPVMKDGKLLNFMLRFKGMDRSYRCKCGCNVFHKPDSRRPDIYRCNACEDTFETE